MARISSADSSAYDPSADVAELTGPPAERGWLVRLVSPQGGGGTSTTLAFLLGVAGAVAFAASLALDWVTVQVQNTATGRSGSTTGVGLSLTNAFTVGLVYALGVLILLAFLGLVINRPDLALRARLGAGGLGLGLLAVEVGAVLRAPVDLTGQVGATLGAVSYEAGTACGFVAVVLPTVAVWLAARPAARAAAAAEVEAVQRHRSRYAAPFEPFADERRVTIEPRGGMDLTVTPDGGG